MSQQHLNWDSHYDHDLKTYLNKLIKFDGYHVDQVIITQYENINHMIIPRYASILVSKIKTEISTEEMMEELSCEPWWLSYFKKRKK